jgi:O-antigen/teichoic acid export membrane protein
MLAGRAIFLTAGFGVSVILARGLGSASFGVYSVVMSVITWIERILSAGVPGATATLLSSSATRAPEVEQTARVLLFFWSLVLFALCWLVAPHLAAYFDMSDGAMLFRIVSVDIVLMSVFYAYDGIFNGRHNFAGQAALIGVQALVKLLAVAAMLLIGLSVAMACVAHVFATFATIAWVLARHPPGRTWPTRESVRTMLTLSLPFGVYLIVMTLLTSITLWQRCSMQPAGSTTCRTSSCSTWG